MLRDKDIREPLFDFLEETYGKIRIIEEKTMGKSRADVVMVTSDSIIGLEIKSDADTYARLSRQVKDYDKFYDRNIVVVGTSHAMHIEEHVPDHWGIITVETVGDECDFYFLRRPKINPKMALENKLRILWRPELFELQQIYEMPKYKDKSKDFVVSKLAERVPEKIDRDDLDFHISRILFERDYTKADETLNEYRKGELQKAIEQETDPERKLALMVEQAEKGLNFKPRKKRRRRRR
ncbi:sce7726 family protein [Butyrivibrio sp. WCD3002]|uniref:sce7726 family protein n=1 Tax=Butyrivibrio sp. WCD3002 TaxID=1280676 RepID=UPI000416C65C|nr:sce7726 family protein [Butyrivibrio sp. WCD3002]